MKMSHATKRAASMLSVALIVSLMLSVFSVGVRAENSAVTSASKGVLRLNIVYTDDYNQPDTLPSGTCFLINSSNAVTASHVVTVTDDVINYFAGRHPDKTTQEIYSRLKYTVTVSRDVTIEAKIKHQSQEMDYAVLLLDTSLQDRSALTMRHSSSVNMTEEVFAIGFPELSEIVQDVNTFTSDDVTITNGTVGKVSTGVNPWSHKNTDYIQTNCQLNHGISGGPMVDTNGNVIGICQSGVSESDADTGYFYAICIDQVLSVCDSLGISYTLNEGEGTAAPVVEQTPPAETPPSPQNVEPAAVDYTALRSAVNRVSEFNEADYTPSSFAALREALASANSALTSNDQNTVNSAASALERAINGLEKPEPASNSMLYILIAAAAVVVIAVVAAVIVMNSKKKKAVPAAAQRPAQQPMGGGFAPSPAQPARAANIGAATRAGETSVLNHSAGETTVLSHGAGETTVLSQQVNGGALIRRKTGERIDISRSDFIIGRERNQVTFCISDNTSIGRMHAKLVVRNGATYIVDLSSRNGTFVNGVKSVPNQEIPLKSGDKIMLADEEFEYRA